MSTSPDPAPESAAGTALRALSSLNAGDIPVGGAVLDTVARTIQADLEAHPDQARKVAGRGFLAQPPAHELYVDEGELELCLDCAVDDDPQTEPGVGQTVLRRSIETDPDWDTALGKGPEYFVTWLACGHTTAELV